MNTPGETSVALLMATYNGARFVEEQIKSFKANQTLFTLHWLDDQSTDDTREIVRATAQRLGIRLKEWHQPQRLGIPGVFFQLLECVEADIYLFADQDDVWQPGKIDITVKNLLPDLASPALCFSEPFMFKNDRPEVLTRISEVVEDTKAPKSLQDSRLFMALPAVGHTQGFTRPLRDLYIKHKDIARKYAIAHGPWMYIIAVASGTRRLLTDVPTTLYRQHGNNFSEFVIGAVSSKGMRQYPKIWRLQQMLRPRVARQAEGFILASSTLPPGPKLDRVLAVARLVATVNRRQSLVSLMRLIRRGTVWPSRRSAVIFAAACFCTDAKQ